MKLDDFLDECRTDIGRFARMWIEGRNKDAGMYPLDLPAGDWFDQYIGFLTSNDRDKTRG